MWAKLDDALFDHAKILQAGRAFRLDKRGPDGRVYALGLFAFFLLYANKHLTNGFIASDVLEEWQFVTRPLDAAAIMVRAGFLEPAKRGSVEGFKIHDFHDHNPHAEDIHEKRKRDRERKRKGGRNRHGLNGHESAES